MKLNPCHPIILAAATACGFALSAFADTGEPNTLVPAPAAAPVVVASGLLGQTYAGLTYRHIDLDGPAGYADNYRFNFNEALRTGFDGRLSFDWTEAGSSSRQLAISAGLRAYYPDLASSKPYVEVGAGYASEKVAGVKDDSFLFQLGVGAEFQVAPAVTVTPFIRFEDAPNLSRNGRWDYGVKANYWVTGQWALTAGVDRDDDQNTGVMIGTNFRY